MKAKQPKVGDVLSHGGRHYILDCEAHSAVLSHRWLARCKETGGLHEALFVEDSQDLGPLLAADSGVEICNWPCQSWETDAGKWRLFDSAPISLLSDVIKRFQPSADPDNDEARSLRFAHVDAILELLELLNEVAEVVVAGVGLDVFGFKGESSAPEGVLRRPELVSALSSPPVSGSSRSTGLTAPEVSGLISRPVDVRADVWLAGMIAYALFTGVRPTEGVEQYGKALPEMRAFDPGLPLGIRRAVRQALRRLPDERQQSVAVLRAQLRAAWERRNIRRLVGADRRAWITYAYHSEIGRRKMQRYPVNQDAHLEIFDPNTGWGVFVVADGVSRAKIGRGELASWLSRTAVEEGWNLRRATPIYGKFFEGASPFPQNFLDTLAMRAHERVGAWLDLLLTQPATPRGTSTFCSTLSIVATFRDRCAITTIGDSPVYLVRLDDGFLEKVTVDQTKTLFLVRHGIALTSALSDAGAKHLSSAVGRTGWTADGQNPVRLDLPKESTTFRLLPGDILLSCSDGIPDALGNGHEEKILRILTDILGKGAPNVVRTEAELTAAARALVREADEAGGQDNLTAVIVSIGPHSES